MKGVHSVQKVSKLRSKLECYNNTIIFPLYCREHLIMSSHAHWYDGSTVDHKGKPRSSEDTTDCMHQWFQ